MNKYCFGVDLGGTTVKLGLFDPEGTVLDKWEIPTRKEDNGSKILPDIAKAIEDKILGSEEKVVALEYEEFTKIRTEIARNIERLFHHKYPYEYLTEDRRQEAEQSAIRFYTEHNML